MDPLSVLGVIGSAVATGRTIATILQDCCDARDDLITAKNQVTDLQCVLDQLRPTEDGGSRPKKLTKATKRCGKILSKIDELLEEYRNKRLRWAFRDKARLAELQRDLEASKSTLLIYINNNTNDKADRVYDLLVTNNTNDKVDRMYDRLGDVEMKLDALANSNNSRGPPLALPPSQGTPSSEPTPLPLLLQGVPLMGFPPLPQASSVPGHLPPPSQGIPSRGPTPLRRASRVLGPQFSLSRGIPSASQPQGIPSRAPIPSQQGIPSRGAIPLQPGIPSTAPVPSRQGIPSRAPLPLPQVIPSRGPLSLQQGVPPRGPIPPQQGIASAPPLKGIPQRGPPPPPRVPQTNPNLQYGVHQNPYSSTTTPLWPQPAQPSHDRTAFHTAQ